MDNITKTTIRRVACRCLMVTFSVLCLFGCGKHGGNNGEPPRQNAMEEACQSASDSTTYTVEPPARSQQETEPVVTEGTYTAGDEGSGSSFYDEGYEKGYQDGYDDGLDNARDNTYDDSCAYRGKGCDDFEEGYRDGYDAGFDDGYEETGGDPDMEE